MGVDEVRARQIPCTEEAISGGDARRADWLIENALVRVALRDAGAALTRLGVAGGTPIDIARADSRDGLGELIPYWEGAPMTDASVSAWNDDSAAGIDVVGTLEDGREVSVTWWLQANDRHLYVDGPDEVELLAGAGGVRVGDTAELRTVDTHGSSLLMIGDAPLSIAEGERSRWAGATQWSIGSRKGAQSGAWEDGIPVSGTASTGAWVLAQTQGLTVARFRVDDAGTFSGTAPPETDTLLATGGGFSDGPGEPPAEALSLIAGEEGRAWVQVMDSHGLGIPATVWLDDQRWPIPSVGTELQTGAFDGPVWVTAGPAYEAVFIPEQRIAGSIQLPIQLRDVGIPDLLADLDVASWPDVHEPRTAATVATEVAAGGVRYAVFTATDEIGVASVDAWTERWLLSREGSRSGHPDHAPVAWPWGASARKAAHGAVDWSGLDPVDQLSAMSPAGGRFTHVDVDWIVAAGQPAHWRPAPTAARLDSLDDLEVVRPLWDAGQPIGVVGPLTWMAGLPPGEMTGRVDVERFLVTHATVATSGPWIAISADDTPIGGTVPRRRLHDDDTITVTAEARAATWQAVTHLAIIGPQGRTLGSWVSPSPGEPIYAELQVDRGTRWVAAIAWGERTSGPAPDAAPWAATSPIWIAAPGHRGPAQHGP